ncbi:hypothetical protein LUZ60_006730 [Juncus effusus]|nr:hypothetical protein LUZ60_006730 [Juncus effusus]
MEKNRSGAESVVVKKDRHVVTWSAQEDELLREQIAIHGTNNWTSISANFKDKTSRQCRRRWYTYLNSEFKKGGWSQEEDMLLCEAQKILGNKWTEIAKVVSGRTDNAVKNRFSTLCKKRARNEALYKENNTPIINSENNIALNIKNRLISAGIGESSLSAKHMRYDILNSSEKMRKSDNGLRIRELNERKPLSEISQNAGNSIARLYNVDSSKGTFLKRDDPKLATLFQQAELLSSLAIKVNSGDSKERFDEAWKQLEEYLNQREGKETVQNEMSDLNSLLDELRDLIEDLRSNNNNNEEISQIGPQNLEPLQMGPSRSSEEDHNSEILQIGPQNLEILQIGPQNLEILQISPQNLESELQKDASRSAEESNLAILQIGPQILEPQLQMDASRSSEDLNNLINITSCDNLIGKEICKNLEGKGKNLMDSNFQSPIQKFPAFQSADILSPKFSESERKFLLTVLGMASPNSNLDPSKGPSCKRALL